MHNGKVLNATKPCNINLMKYLFLFVKFSAKCPSLAFASFGELSKWSFSPLNFSIYSSYLFEIADIKKKEN